MNEKFFDLSREKQDRMINGAIEVFAKNGFKHASTDDMVKAVEVSKGLWFHYFGSKAGLYRFVYGFSVKYVVLELASVLNPDEKDFFEILKQVEYTKMRVSRVYPYMNEFLAKALNETDEEILDQTEEDRKIFKDRMSSIYKSGDIEGVTDKATKDKIKKMLQYTINGVIEDKGYTSRIEPESLYRELRNYIELTRAIVAKANDVILPQAPAKEDMMIDAAV